MSVVRHRSQQWTRSCRNNVLGKIPNPGTRNGPFLPSKLVHSKAMDADDLISPLVRAGMGNSKLLLLLTLRSTTTIHDSHHFHPPVLPLVVHRSRSPSDVNIKEGDDCYLRYLATTDPPR